MPQAPPVCKGDRYAGLAALLCGFVLAAVEGGEGPRAVNIAFTQQPEGRTSHRRWRSVCGKWAMSAGRCIQEDHVANPAYIFAPAAAVSDFRYSVRIKVLPAGRAQNAGLVFRSVDSGRFYYAQIGVRHRQIILVKATPRKQWTEIARRRGLDLAVGRWHHVGVEATADRIRIALDGRRVLTAQDATYPVGCVGLRTGLARVEFSEPKLVGKPAAAKKEWSIVNTDWTGDDVPRIQGGERFIAASGETGAGMFPKALLLPDGEVVAAIRGGAPHIGAGGRLDTIRSADGGRTWTKPATMFRSSRDDRGPSLGQASDGPLVCMYRIYDAYDEDGKWKRTGFDQYTMLSLSHDQGHTWTQPVEVKLPPLPFVCPFQRMVCLDDGALLMPAYASITQETQETQEREGRKPGAWAFVVRSTDNGRTWGDVSYMAHGFNETALLPLPDGRLLAAMRHKSDGLWTSTSGDRGYTWSEPKQATTGSRYPADLLMLPSGKVLMVYGRRHPAYGIECRLSADNGATWGDPLSLAWTATNTDCGYPSGVVLGDGTILVLWYAVASADQPDLGFHCEAMRFREEDLTTSLRP